MDNNGTKTEQLLNALENGGDISKIVGCCNTNLQNYLIQSIDSVDQAKDAITEKGGTVGDTGLAGLAEEIATIPSGGGGLDNYGTITYLDSDNVEHTVVLETIDDFLELSTPITSDSAVMHINQQEIKKNSVTSVTIADGVTFLPDYFGFYLDRNGNTVTLPSSIVAIGSYFFSYGYVSNELNLQNVKSIGPNFLASATYNNAISLPSVEFIDGSFLSGNTFFNSSISINDNCRYIGSSFLTGCSNFAQPLTIPSGLEDAVASGLHNPDENFLRGCNAFTGPLVCNGPTVSTMIPTGNYVLSATSSSAAAYTTGITLTGPYAQAWKNALPDRTSSPYRKLIVGN